MTLPASVEPTVQVSWLGDGTFLGPYDDVTDAVAGDPGLTVEVGKDGSRTLSPPKAESADFELLNDDGYYSGASAAAPLYQFVIPARPVRTTVTHGERRTYRSHTAYRDHVPYRGRAVYRLSTTAIDAITQTLGIGNRRVRLETLGALSTLMDQKVSTQVYSGITTGQAISNILTAAGWNPALTAFDTGETTFAYWWMDERSPWDALLEVLASEGPGAIWVDGDGVFHFESRGHRTVSARSTTSQAAIYDTIAGQRTGYRDHVPYRAHRLYRGRIGTLFATDMAYEPGLGNIVNRATFATRRRTVGALQSVWDYGATLVLGPSQQQTLIAKPSDPYIGAVAPVAGVDYTVTSGSASVSLTRTSGLAAYLVVQAGAGGAQLAGVTSTGIQLRAQPLTVVSETTVQNSVDASGSIAQFAVPVGSATPRTLEIKGWPETEPAQAVAVCNAWVSRYQWPRPQIAVTLRNADAAHVRTMLDLRVSDRLTLREENSGIDFDVWLESKRLNIGPGGRSVVCELRCEQVDRVAGFPWDGGSTLWDSATWGI